MEGGGQDDRLLGAWLALLEPERKVLCIFVQYLKVILLSLGPISFRKETLPFGPRFL